MYSNAINTVGLVYRAIKGLSTGPVLLKFQVLISLSVLVLLYGLGQTAPNQHNENLSMCYNRKSFPSCRWKGCTNVAWHLEAMKTAAVRCLFLERITQQIHKLLGSFLVRKWSALGSCSAGCCWALQMDSVRAPGFLQELWYGAAGSNWVAGVRCAQAKATCRRVYFRAVAFVSRALGASWTVSWYQQTFIYVKFQQGHLVLGL